MLNIIMICLTKSIKVTVMLVQFSLVKSYNIALAKARSIDLAFNILIGCKIALKWADCMQKGEQCCHCRAYFYNRNHMIVLKSFRCTQSQQKGQYMINGNMGRPTAPSTAGMACELHRLRYNAGRNWYCGISWAASKKPSNIAR